MAFTRLAPNIADLQTGDLVWPRSERQIVFFREDNPQAQPWLQAQAQMQLVSQSAEQAELVQRFMRDAWVGHVALIEIIDGVPWVVDATPHRSGWAEPRTDGVATQPYQAFLDDSSHTESHIWHGRLIGQKEGFGERLVNAAKKHLGAKYSIDPRNLEKADDFYCSKLIWHALRDGLGITLEKTGWHVPQPWFTPWDLMQAGSVRLLYEPAGKSYLG